MIIYTYILYFVLCICILYFYLGVVIAILPLHMMRIVWINIISTQLWDVVVDIWNGIFGDLYGEFGIWDDVFCVWEGYGPFGPLCSILSLTPKRMVRWRTAKSQRNHLDEDYFLMRKIQI